MIRQSRRSILFDVLTGGRSESLIAMYMYKSTETTVNPKKNTVLQIRHVKGKIIRSA